MFFGFVFINLFEVVKRKHVWKKWMTLAALMILLFLINMTEQGNYVSRNKFCDDGVICCRNE